MPCIMNAANEAAVAAFLQGKISFYDITDIVKECMETSAYVCHPDIETIFGNHESTLSKAAEIINRKTK